MACPCLYILHSELLFFYSFEVIQLFCILVLKFLKQLSSLLKISVSFLLIFSSLTASGGDPFRLSAGAAEAGTGYVCIAKTGFWSSFHNQATLPYYNSFSAAINYENRFGIRELGTRTAGLIFPTGKTALAVILSHFGYSDFYRNMAGLACGVKLSDRLSAGIQIDYFSERVSGEYKNSQSLTCEAGLLFIATENTRIGIHILNPVPNSLRKTFIPSILRIGAGTNLNKSLFAGIEAEMSKGSQLIIRTGFEYETAKKFWMRGGFSSDNNSFSFGLGYLVRIVQLDIGFVTHEKLGVTSSVSLIFKIH
jgi:hypothetical protein